MALSNRMIVLAALLGSIGCTRTVIVQPATPTSSTAPVPTSTSPTSAASAARLSTKHDETVIVLPDLGSVSWTCRGEARQSRTFRTTFTGMNATENVSYSLGAAPPISQMTL